MGPSLSFISGITTALSKSEPSQKRRKRGTGGGEGQRQRRRETSPNKQSNSDRLPMLAADYVS